MITGEQLEELSKFYKIDGFSILREHLQLVFLNYFYQQEKSKNCFFKGGTAIRLLLNSPRFSEDLDFSTTLSRQNIKNLLSDILAEVRKEIPSLEIRPLYSGKETERYRLRYQGSETKYPLTIRLDFNRIKKELRTEVSSLQTRFPIVIFPLIRHLTSQAILIEKIKALETRSKPRDLFDVWYLLELGIKPKGEINKEELIRKIKHLSLQKLKRSLSPFLPKSKRKILENLRERVLEYFQTNN